MEKNKGAWVMALAIAIGVSVTSCQNEKLLEESKKKNLPNANSISLSENFIPANFDISKYKIEDIKAVEDYLEEIEDNKEEKNDNIYQKTR